MGNYSLILVLSVTFAIIVFGDLTRKNLYRSEVEIVETYTTNQAKNIAQSVAMAVGKKLNDGEAVVSVPDYQDWEDMGGSYKFLTTVSGDTLTLTVWGKVDDISYEQEVIFKTLTGEPVWQPSLPYAVFTGVEMDLTGSAKVVGHVGTNATDAGAVSLDWSTSIDSSLYIGPGGDPATTVIQQSGNNVKGDLGNLPSPGEYEMPKFIDYPAKTVIRSPVLTVWPFTNITLNPSDYDGAYIPSVTVQSNYTLNIDTGTEDRVMHVGDFNLYQGTVNVTGTGKLTLIVENNLYVNGSSRMNTSGDQENLFTYYGGSNRLDFGGSTNFNGSVYAETADIHIGGSGGIQGHIITGGESVVVDGAAQANTRVLYAPNANVEVNGSGRIRGAIVAKQFIATGAGMVEFSSEMTSSIPELEMEDDGGSGGYYILSWY